MSGQPERRDIPAAGEVEDPNRNLTQATEGDPFMQDYLQTMERSQTQAVSPGDYQLDRGYDSRLGYTRIAAGNNELSQQIDYITNMLAMGEQVAATQNMQNASRFYGAAIRQADQVFDAVGAQIAQRRPEFAQQLQQEQDPYKKHDIMVAAIQAERNDLQQRIAQETNPTTKQQLAQYEMDLHTIERAPGFTRANYGLLLMRAGHYNPNNPQDPALRALKEAVAFDKTLIPDPTSTDPRRQLGDPNFMRVVTDITGMQPGDPNLSKVLAPIFGREIQLPPNGYDSRQPQGSDYEAGTQPVVPGDQRVVPGDQGQVNPVIAADGTQPIEQPVIQPQETDNTAGTTRYVNGKTPFQRVVELAQLVASQGLTPDIRERYLSAIQDSDVGTSPRLAELDQRATQIDARMTELANKLEQFEENPPPEILAEVQKGKAALAQKTPEQQAQFQKLAQDLAQAQDNETRQRILAQMNEICPEFVKVIEMSQQAVQPLMEEFAKLQAERAQLDGEIMGERNQAAATRMEFAEKLLSTGNENDKQAAKALLLECVQKARPEDRQKFADAALSLAREKGLPLTDEEVTTAASQGDQQGDTPVQPGQSNVPSSELTGTSKMIDDNRRAFDAAFAAATDKTTALTPEMEQKFKDAVTAADRDFTTASTRYDDLIKQQQDILNGMPAEDKAQFEKMLNQATPEAEAAQIETAMKAKYPNLVQIETEMATLEQQGLDLALNRFASRMDYARALSLTGKDDQAKPILEEAYRHLITDAGADIATRLQADPEVKELTTKLGIDVQNLARSAESDQPVATDGDLAGKSVEELIRIGGYRIKNKDAEGAKKAYEQAIAIIDQNYNAEENNRAIQQLQDALKSGTLNGKQLTAQDRLAVHEDLKNRFQNAMLAYEVRAGYAEVMNAPAYGQFAAAEKAYKDAAEVAKQIPVQAMKDQVGLIAQEMERVTDESALAGLSEFASALEGDGDANRGWINTPINAQKDLASFYVRLVIDTDENGQPRLNPDGTPKFRPDGSEVFKPEEGFKAIEEAKRLMKEIRGIDLDANPGSDPTLSALAHGIYENSPENLKKQMQNTSKFWHDAVADTGAGIVGLLTTAAVAALAIKYKPLRGILTKEAAAGTKLTALGWTAAIGVGGLSATATRNVTMTQIFGREDETLQRSLVHGYGSTLGAIAIGKGGKWAGDKIFFRGLTKDSVGAAGRTALGLADDAAADARMLQVLKTKMNIPSTFETYSAWAAQAKPHQLGEALGLFKSFGNGNELLSLANNTAKYATQLSDEGVSIAPALVDKMKAARLTVTGVEAGAPAVKLRTVRDLQKYVNALHEANPTALTRQAADDILNSVSRYDGSTKLSTAWGQIAAEGPEAWQRLSVIKQLVPGAGSANRPGMVSRFRTALAEAEGVGAKSRVVGNALLSPVRGVGNTAYTLVGRPGASAEALTPFSITMRRHYAGSLAGLGGFSAYNYPTAWNHMFLENNTDQNGKPYEFNFSNAIVRPAWKSPHDNIFVSSLVLGGFGARPGMLSSISPFQGGAWGKIKGAGGFILGDSTMHYAQKFGGDAAGQAATYFVFRQWGDLINNLDNIGAARQYSDLLDATQRNITDRNLTTGQPGAPQEQQQAQPQEQPQEQPSLTPERQETGTGTGTPIENTDLTGGAPR